MKKYNDLALAAAKKAGERLLQQTWKAPSKPSRKSKRSKQCPYAKAAKTVLAGAGIAAGTALGAAALRTALTPRKTSRYVPAPDGRAMDYGRR